MHKIKYIFPLVFIFLCLKVKAEYLHSAFSVYGYTQIDSSIVKRYELAKILYEQNQPKKSLKLVFKISEKSSGYIGKLMTRCGVL